METETWYPFLAPQATSDEGGCGSAVGLAVVATVVVW